MCFALEALYGFERSMDLRQAARAMLGLAATAPPQPSFWSDQYGTRIQQIGHTGLADGVTIDGDLAARDFTAHYTRGGRPVGALLVGRPHALPDVRRWLVQPDAQPESAEVAA